MLHSFETHLCLDFTDWCLMLGSYSVGPVRTDRVGVASFVLILALVFLQSRDFFALITYLFILHRYYFFFASSSRIISCEDTSVLFTLYVEFFVTVAFVIASTDLSSLLLLPSSFSTEINNVIWGRTNFNWSYTSLLIILRDFLPPLDFTSVSRTSVISLWNFGSWDSSFFSFSFCCFL